MSDPLPEKSPKLSLAKPAAILAITASVSFGLCAVGVIVGSGSRFATIAGPAATFFAGLVAVCLAGLLILAVIAVVRAIIDSFSDKESQ